MNPDTYQGDHRDDAAPLSLPELFDRNVSEWRNVSAINFFGRRLTYRNLGELVNCTARGYQDMGIGKGSKVGLLMVNSPHFVIQFFGALKAGATVVNLNPLATRRDFLETVRKARLDAIATLDLQATYPNARAALDGNHIKNLILCPLADMLPFPKNHLYRAVQKIKNPPAGRDRRMVTHSYLLKNHGSYEFASIDPVQDTAMLQFTGGTTGIPKGAMLTHFNLAANATQIKEHFEGTYTPGAEKMLLVIPTSHIFALTAGMLTALNMGAEMILLPDPRDMDKIFNVIEKEKPALFLGVPGLFQMMLQHPRAQTADLSSMRLCISGGAPLPPSVKDAFEAKTGGVLVEGYGLTETSPVVTINPPYKELNRAGSIGVPVKGTEIRITDPEDFTKDMPRGEIGRVCIRGPQVMKGYYKNAEETGRALQDGWLLTRDLGRVDADGYYHLVDRLDDLILSNGFNVYPTKIENAILQHPDVAECLVIGVPDEKRGEVPKAFIRFRDGQARTESEMSAFLKPLLSRVEIPRQYEFTDEPLPKTAVGKLDRKALRAREKQKAMNAPSAFPSSTQPS